MRFGCIGEKLVHSFSKEIHGRLTNDPYELINLKPEEVEAFFQKRAFEGINVTIPFKQTILPFLDVIDPLAKRIGAVNTVICKDNLLYGYNTDYNGMNALISRLNLDLKGKKTLILGTGGTSNTAFAVAEDLGADPIIKVSRSGARGVSYEAAKEEHSDARIIINTTPCGMFPAIHQSPVQLSDFPSVEGVIDAVYNPLRSELVSAAREKGIPAEGGLYMLVVQAICAAERFHSVSFPVSDTERVYKALLFEKENFVLTGMPGCGKSTVGKLLAAKTDRPFYDMDDLITERTGLTPSEWIRSRGESAFRRTESELIESFLSVQNGSVIATGGGAVLDLRNVFQLKQNGRIFFLYRPIEQISAFANRPLSSSPEMLRSRWGERKEIYRSTADRIIRFESPSAACERILEDYQ